jgi:hypothetical protein
MRVLFMAFSFNMRRREKFCVYKLTNILYFPKVILQLINQLKQRK